MTARAKWDGRERRRRPRGRCHQMVRFLQDYVDGTLPAADRVRFERHIADCPGCVAFLHTYRETVRLGRSLRSDDEIPADLRARILAATRRSTSGR